MNLPQYNRNPMPGRNAPVNPEMAQQIEDSPTFSAIAAEVAHQREVQAQKYFYVYTLNDEIVGQTTAPFNIQIEQGTDFWCQWITASAFSYDADEGDETTFPIPNSIGALSWAGRGLSLEITDTRSARKLTSGYVPFELLGTPGYGLNFQNPYPLRYFFYRNTKIRFDVRNRDNENRTHEFSIALAGYKILTPGM